MAKLEFLLQGITKANHASSLLYVFDLPKIRKALISVAFVKEAGVAQIEDAIKRVKDDIRIFVGIRNDITSIQGLKRLLKATSNVYAVDTGAKHIVFHPKVYLAANNTDARAVIGSANLTLGGMYRNIEASTALELSLSESGDKEYVQTTLKMFRDMISSYPEHVFRLTGEPMLEKLFSQGRLADEAVAPPPPSKAPTIKKESTDKLGQMPLQLSKHIKAVSIPKPVTVPVLIPAASKKVVSAVTGYVKVWESKALRRRDLSIPNSPNTNPTGSMLFKQGLYDKIDQLRYFRKNVFNDLNWSVDEKKPIWERASATFTIVIKGVNQGDYELKLSHNADETSRTYEEKNGATQIHWGSASAIIRDENLLGRTLVLRKKDGNPPRFVIEID